MNSWPWLVGALVGVGGIYGVSLIRRKTKSAGGGNRATPAPPSTLPIQYERQLCALLSQLPELERRKMLASNAYNDVRAAAIPLLGPICNRLLGLKALIPWEKAACASRIDAFVRTGQPSDFASDTELARMRADHVRASEALANSDAALAVAKNEIKRLEGAGVRCSLPATAPTTPVR